MGRPMAAVLSLAGEHGGYFTTAQAADAGVTRQVLSHYVELGYLQRMERGIYRLVAHPRHPHEQILVACLWAGPGAAASHESALVVHGVLDDVGGPAHVTARPGFGGRRRDTVVHHASLDAADIVEEGGVPVTGVERTVLDLARTREPVVTAPWIDALVERQLLSDQRLRALAMASPAVAAAAQRTIFRLNRGRRGAPSAGASYL